MTTLHHPLAAGPDAESGARIVDLTPQEAGWQYCGLRVVGLSAGESRTIATGDAETFVLPLIGGVTISVQHDSGKDLGAFVLHGRASVFTAVSDFLYVGRDSQLRLTAGEQSCQLALPSSRCNQHLPPRYGPAEDVPVEVRGAGNATRQVTNFGVPGVWDHAEKLICCELITPSGNWSSYPPHKHDASEPCTVVNEEIYYYRIAGEDQITPSRQGMGYHQTYTGPEHEKTGLEPLDALIEVRDHDVVVVPHGYHGPCIAAPGYPMYYLNIMAGPAVGRELAFCDDPDHAWVRDTWQTMEIDPRCPVTSAAGRLDGITPSNSTPSPRERHT